MDRRNARLGSVTGTPFERIWDRHVVADYGDGRAMIYIDRHFAHEGTSGPAFDRLRREGLAVRRPRQTLAVIDHALSTEAGRTAESFAPSRAENLRMRANCRDFGVHLVDVDDADHGIEHVIAPHLGFALPGCTYVCGDSHTASCGGLGAWAWGIGTSEVAQVFAAQALVVRRPRATQIEFHGTPAAGVFAKDLILHLIGRFGVDAGAGQVVQYAGAAIRALPVEGRLTICNMSIEFGARGGFIAADDTTFQYLYGRPFAPKGVLWDRAVADWRALFADAGAGYDRVLSVDSAAVEPQVTWGTSPGDVIGIGDRIPDPTQMTDPDRRASAQRSLDYMGLSPGAPIAGTPINIAFIGSCTNGRLSDLEAAAAVIRGRKVAPGVRALVVPGARHVKAAAEAKGIDRAFRDAGFEWREPGCSMCVGAGGDIVPKGLRSISTSNRNFEGRQGPSSRTHLASPATVAAAALTGRITDVRRMAD